MEHRLNRDCDDTTHHADDPRGGRPTRIHAERPTRPPPRRSPTVTHPDLDLERERDLDREWREPSLELAGERAGERLADFPEPCGLALPDAERDS